MRVQVVVVIDENNNILATPRWEVNEENKGEIDTYLKNNPNHLALFSRKWGDEVDDEVENN